MVVEGPEQGGGAPAGGPPVVGRPVRVSAAQSVSPAPPRAGDGRSRRRRQRAPSPTAVARTTAGSAPGGRCRCGSCCLRSTLIRSSSTAKRPGRRKGGVRSELANIPSRQIRGAVDTNKHLRSERTDRTTRAVGRCALPGGAHRHRRGEAELGGQRALHLPARATTTALNSSGSTNINEQPPKPRPGTRLEFRPRRSSSVQVAQPSTRSGSTWNARRRQPRTNDVDPRRATAIIAATEEGVPPPTPNELSQRRRRVPQPTSQFTHIDHAHRTQVTSEFTSQRRQSSRS